MKRTIYAVMLLLGLGIVLASCNKDETLSESTLVGNRWKANYIFYFDGERIGYDPYMGEADGSDDLVDLYYLGEDKRVERYHNLITEDNSKTIDFNSGYTFEFGEDGSLYVTGSKQGTWTINGNQIILSGNGRSWMGTFENGKIMLNSWEVPAYGYCIYKYYDTDYVKKNLVGYDGELHTIKVQEFLFKLSDYMF